MIDPKAPSTPRSRLYPPRKRDFLKVEKYFQSPPPLNHSAHQAAHSPTEKMWTSKATLDLTTSTAWVPTFPGRMVDVAFNTSGPAVTPATTASILDMQLNTTSVFVNDNERPQIGVGKSHSNIAIITRGVFLAGDSWAFQVTTTGTIAGPIVATFRYLKDP